MKTNIRPIGPHTHEGAPAARCSDIDSLRRSVLSCLLWESEFYEDGTDISQRIATLVPRCEVTDVATLALQAREEFHLRHVPLWLVVQMCRNSRYRHLVSSTLAAVIQRPDELTEFLSLYWKERKCPLSASAKKGLALAFRKFDRYALAKYNRDAAIKLRDVLFMCHAKPLSDDQARAWKELIDGTLPTPDTWEVELSASKDKRLSWTRLLVERKLGGLALLRNLRNMIEVGVSNTAIREGILLANYSRVLPFRFIAAAKYAPRFEHELETMLFRSLRDTTATLPRQTTLLIDVSGSMDAPLSEKSDLVRLDAACGIAMIVRELCEDVQVFTFSNYVKEIPNRRGFALRDSIVHSQDHDGTNLGNALSNLPPTHRLIVVTDEQSHDLVGRPNATLPYMINVASAQNGVGYGVWTHIDGFSEAVVRFILELEASSED